MRFTITATSSADYDSEHYFTAERSFNTEDLDAVTEHLGDFLKSVGFCFDSLEPVTDFGEEEFSEEDLQEAEEYNRTYINRK